MIGYLIDPESRTVTQVNFTDLDSVYKLLKCDSIDVARLSPYNGDGIYVDDNGLLTDPRHFFKVKGYWTALAGRGLLHGINDEGEDIPPKRSIDDLFVQFYSLAELAEENR